MKVHHCWFKTICVGGSRNCLVWLSVRFCTGEDTGASQQLDPAHEVSALLPWARR